MLASTFKKPHIIVLGNEKGGTGKSTISMHLIVHLIRLGYSVGSIDADARQGTLTRYLENRQQSINKIHKNLPISEHFPLTRADFNMREEAEADERKRLQECLEKLSNKDFIVIDTPGTDNFLSRLVHSHADTLITPLNDSLIDFDMLGRVNFERQIEKPSTYAEMIWDQRKHRLMRDGGKIDWIVLRNRLSNLMARNKEEMQNLLNLLSQRIKFRLASGFSERVIFRELFLSGLTLLDLPDIGVPLNISHVAARQELRDLIDVLGLPTVAEK
ncbi:MAG: division plane positioning ATPase MipZ [Janthinobacterium lividum]